MLMADAVQLAREGRFDEALRAIETALVKSPIDARTLDAAGEVYGLVGNYPRARDHYERALALHSDPDSRRNTLVRLAQAHRALSQHALASERYESALALARQPVDRALILYSLGGLNLDLGKYAEALDCFEEACRLGDRRMHALALAGAGATLGEQGEHDRAIERLREAIRELGEDGAAATALGDLGMIHLDRGETGEARPILERFLEVARDAGGPWTQARALLRLGLLHGADGERFFRECITVSRVAEMPIILPDALRLRARIRLERNDERGRRDSEEAVELARGTGNPFALGEALSTLARFTGDRAALDEARKLVGSGTCPRALLTVLEDAATMGDREAARRGLALAEARGFAPFAGKFRRILESMG